MTEMVPTTDDTSAVISLSGMREAHVKLVERQLSGVSLVNMTGDVQTFINLARRAGATLYLSEDRQLVQALIDYWSAVLFRINRDVGENVLEPFAEDRLPTIEAHRQPYVGLDPFTEDKALYFFGREKQVDAMLARLNQGERFLAVIGPSGSGKSSLILAGLVPALKNGKGFPESTNWRYLGPIVPGSDPVGALTQLYAPPAAATAKSPAPPKLTSDSLRTSFDADADAVACLVVDQFEEVFTLCADENSRAQFIKALVDLATNGDKPHRVVLTMRSDFVDLVARYPDLHALFNQHEIRVQALAEEELRNAIRRPAQKVGLEFDPGLVDMIVKDTLGERAILPLLQVTLLELWRKRRGNRLTREAYRNLGNPRLALSKVAEEQFGELLIEEQATARRIFLRIVHPTEGVEFTRKRVARVDLAAGENNQERFDRVLMKLREAGLVRYTEADPISQSKIEIPHEALVRNWERLRDWIEEQREDITFRDRLEVGAYNWAYFGRNAGWLNERHVAEARRWMDTTAAKDLGYSYLVQQFVDASEREVLRNRRGDRLRLAMYIILPVVIFAAVAVNMIMEAREAAQEAKLEARVIEAERLRDQAQNEQKAFLAKKNAELAEEIRTKRVKELEGQVTTLTARVAELETLLAEEQQKATTASTAARTTQARLQEAIGDVQSHLSDTRELLRDKTTELQEAQADLRTARRELQILQASAGAQSASSSELRSLEIPPKGESVRIGGAIGMAAESTPAGSVCCVVRTGGGIRYLLTLKTVLPGKPGDLVVQPSRDGRRREKIAVIWRSGKQPSSGVLALPLDGVVADRTVPEYGKLDGTEDNIRSQPNVHMVGWGTPNASGRMMKIENGLIVTDVPATAKDIGAPLFNHDRELVGIVAKIEDGKALARPIDPILDELGVWVD